MNKLVTLSAGTLLSSVLLSLPAVPAFAAPDNNTSASAGVAVSDTWITTKVKAQLTADKITKATTINVTTNNGVVTLSGTVGSETEANKAVEIAESTDGVKDVDTSNLNVSNSNQPMTDSYITAKVKGIFIREKLLHNANIPTLSVKVETQNGVVYLSGEVERKSQADKAVQLANSINGVRQVVSDIKVKG